MNLYQQSLAFENSLQSQHLSEPDQLVSYNRKTVQSFRSLIKFCHSRTPLCEQYCYACKGPISWKNPISKAIAVRRWIETNGVEKAAKRMATEIYYESLFRWMDRGDFDPLTVRLANHLVRLRPDVSFVAFSRNLSALQELSPKISRIYSIDKTSMSHLPSSIKLAFMKVDSTEIPDQVHVVFPLNHRKSLLGHPKDCSFYTNKLVQCATCKRCFT